MVKFKNPIFRKVDIGESNPSTPSCPGFDDRIIGNKSGNFLEGEQGETLGGRRREYRIFHGTRTFAGFCGGIRYGYDLGIQDGGQRDERSVRKEGRIESFARKKNSLSFSRIHRWVAQWSLWDPYNARSDRRESLECFAIYTECDPILSRKIQLEPQKDHWPVGQLSLERNYHIDSFCQHPTGKINKKSIRHPMPFFPY